MRVLGLDYGAKTVGVAMSDPSGLIAQPYKTIVRERESALRKTLAELAELTEAEGVEIIVLGLPLHLNDTEGERAVKTREFAAKLQNRVSAKLIFWDERLTTMEARDILDESGIPRSEQKRVIDQLAAQLILQSYLDERRQSAGTAEKG